MHKLPTWSSLSDFCWIPCVVLCYVCLLKLKFLNTIQSNCTLLISFIATRIVVVVEKFKVIRRRRHRRFIRAIVFIAKWEDLKLIFYLCLWTWILRESPMRFGITAESKAYVSRPLYSFINCFSPTPSELHFTTLGCCSLFSRRNNRRTIAHMSSSRAFFSVLFQFYFPPRLTLLE